MIRCLLTAIFVLAICSCNSRSPLPKCNHPHLQKSPLGPVSVTFSFIKDFNGYIEDLKQAQACSGATGRKILLYFTSLTCNSSLGKHWHPFQNKQVKDLIDDNYILCVLFCDNPEKLQPKDHFYSEISKDTINTLGKRNILLQTSQFQSNVQPMYVLVDEDLNQLSKILSYTPKDQVGLFVDELNKFIPRKKD